MLIVSLDKLADSRLQVGDAGEGGSVQRSYFQLRKPAFHGVQPRRAGRCEVQFEPRMFFLPLLDCSRFVGRTIIQDHMQIQSGWRAAFNLLQKCQKFLDSMALGNLSDDLAGHDVESRVQTRRTMAFLIVRATFNLTWA